ncbi:hypothetical protein [Escherichia coli]|uniref:hypothetical protein n=1 Tax=Escherichia coli TaxID=562 RepID=UPI0013B36709|nr:hypothetical protein [Escherichia coli]
MTYKELFDLCSRIMGNALGCEFNPGRETHASYIFPERYQNCPVRIRFSKANIANFQFSIDTFEVMFIGLEDEDDDHEYTDDSDFDGGNVFFFKVTRYGGGFNEGFGADFLFDDAPEELFFVNMDDGASHFCVSDTFLDFNVERTLDELPLEWLMFQKLQVA